MPQTDAILEHLISAYRLGPEGLHRAFEQHRQEPTPEVATKASKESISALERRDVDRALALNVVAMGIYDFLGRPEDAFAALLNYFNILFMVATTEKQYAGVHQQLVEQLAGKSFGQGEALAALRGWMLVGDCAFFACEAAADDAGKKRWLQAALEALIQGIRFLSGPAAKQLHPQYASIAVAVYRRCLSKRWLGEPWAGANLAKVTQALDQAAPGKLSYPEPGKDDNIDEGRTALSHAFNRGAYGGGGPSGAPLSGLFGRKGR